MFISWYDVMMIAFLLFAVYRGARRGLIWQLAAISAIVLCFVFAQTLSVTIAPMLPGLKPPLNRWAAMFLLYVGFSFISFAAARILKEALERAKFEEFDRHLGAVFGLLKGVVFCLVVTFFAVTLAEDQRSNILASYSGRGAGFLMNRLHPILPDELHDVLEPYLDQIDPGHSDLHIGEDDHDHDDHGHDDPFEPDFFNNFGNGSSSANSTDNSSDPFDTSNLLSHFSSELQQLAKSALSNTAPADRQELLNKITTQFPEAAKNTLLEWQKGKPGSNNNSTPVTSSTNSQSQLLEEIGAIYSDFPQDRAEIVNEIRRSLSGIPDRVATAVLEDWRADLLYKKPDPDPSTSLSTPVEERILSQMKRAGISSPSLGGRNDSSNSDFDPF